MSEIAKVSRSRGDASKWWSTAIGALLFGVALWVLHRELVQVRYREVRAAISALSWLQIILAFILTVGNYLALTGYDQLAFLYVGKRISRLRIALAAFIGYAISNSVGFGMLSGASARFRFYARWGVEPLNLAKIVVFYSSTFWLGLLVLGGWSLAFHPHPSLSGKWTRDAAVVSGIGMLITVASYLAICAMRRKPFQIRGLEFQVPSLTIAVAQIGLSMVDWALAAGVLYVLLPPSDLPYGVVLGAFLTSQILGLVSHVPGGLGIFEGTMVVLLGTHVGHADLLSALVLFRIVYYLIPLTFALVLLLGDMTVLRKQNLLQAGDALRNLSLQIAPRLLSIFTFLAGVLLLFSGATPAQPERLKWLSEILPVGVFEASHFIGSVVGVCLVIVARGVARRLDVAFYVAIGGLIIGIIASLLKGGDWEEAASLAVVLIAFVPSHREFNRETALRDVELSPEWIFAIMGAVAASIWLGLFTFKHVEYRNELWWQFALDRDVSRYLRASVGVAITLIAFALAKFLHPAAHKAVEPSDADLAEVDRILATQEATMSQLVYLRDKAVLFNAERSAFIMYGIQHRTWVALGDPVGPIETGPELVRAFVERAADFSGQAVFYQVKPDSLSLYADLGMTFTKLGEEAMVPLGDFSLEGGSRRNLRSTFKQIEKEKVTFRVVPHEEVTAIMPELKAISDDWLSRQSASEKGFSLGFFDEEYVARFPVAVMEREGRIEAFANVLPGPTHVELSVDLMRYRETAPKGIMEGLFVNLFLWGRQQGYREFSLGMAPLSGVDPLRNSPVRLRLSKWLYHHGESFYNFQGLRAFKEKFHPKWEPRYLAHPVGLTLPRILMDIAALIAGGYRRIFK